MCVLTVLRNGFVEFRCNGAESRQEDGDSYGWPPETAESQAGLDVVTQQTSFLENDDEFEDLAFHTIKEN